VPASVSVTWVANAIFSLQKSAQTSTIVRAGVRTYLADQRSIEIVGEASDDQEARYLITPKLMELIMEAQALLGGQLRLCFMSSNLWVTVPQDKDRFDVGLFSGTVTPESVLGDFIEVVALAERLVETLELETRIWSKA